MTRELKKGYKIVTLSPEMRQRKHMEREKERNIINEVVSGKTDQYRLLVDEYSSLIFSIVVKMVKSREIAEELTQDVFVKGFFSIKKYKGESSFSTWLYRIAYNSSISWLRKKRLEFCSDTIEKKGERVDESEDEILNKINRENEYILLEKAIDQLPHKERFIVLSFYKDEKSIADIALITGFSIQNIKVILHRSRKKIAEDIQYERK